MSAKRKTTAKRRRSTAATSPRSRKRNRNRKLNAEGFRMPATFSLLMVLVFGVGLSYLWLCSRTEALARQINLEEQGLEDLRRKVAAEEVRWNDLMGPRNLRRALKEHHLTMKWPEPHQVVHIRDMALWESTGGEINVVGRLDTSSRGGGVVQ